MKKRALLKTKTLERRLNLTPIRVSRQAYRPKEKIGLKSILISSLLCQALGPFLYSTITLAQQNIFNLSSVDGITGAIFNGATGVTTSNRYQHIQTVASGDINGDGIQDAIFGDSEVTPNGQVYIVYGKLGGVSSALNLTSLASPNGIVINGITSAGWSVSSGDINHDGVDDIIIGARYSANSAGQAYVVYGAKGGLASPLSLSSLTRITGLIATGVFEAGQSVASGDVNGDGIDDVLIGEVGNSPGGRTYAGCVYAIYGKQGGFSSATINLASLNTTAGAVFNGASAYDEAGHSIANGDINADGVDDILIGTRVNGFVYIVYGKQGGFSSPFELSTITSNTGIAINGHSGYYSVASGDVNGDLIADIVIGPQPWIIYGKKTGLPALIDLSTLSVNAGVSLSGAGSSWSVASGDMNGDGIQDVVAGFNSASPNGLSNAGQVYVVYGGLGGPQTTTNLPAINSTTGEIINGITTGDQAGLSVACGDMNGDGVTDSIIWAENTSANRLIHQGYVVYGSKVAPSTTSTSVPTPAVTSTTLTTTTAAAASPPPTTSHFYKNNIDLANLALADGFSIAGAATNDLSGYTVSRAGDVNGDGYDDIIIGASSASPQGRHNAGQSYVIFGGMSLTNLDLVNLVLQQGFSIVGAMAGDLSGAAVSGAGDVNKDGYADVIIGAYNATAQGRAQAGQSYVIYGSANLTNIDLSNLPLSQGFSVRGATVTEMSGYSVGKAGDINDDGYDDFLIGAPFASPYGGDTNRGKAYIIFGNSTMGNIDLSTLAPLKGFWITGAAPGDWFGYSVSPTGDINHDGYDDWLIGAIEASPHARYNAGQSYIFYGGKNLTNINLTTSIFSGSSIAGAFAGGNSGISLGSAGDVNKDGYQDIIIGAYRDNPKERMWAGQSYIVYGKPDLPIIDLANLTSAHGILIAGAQENDRSGIAVSGAGDVNQDGYDDVVIGAFTASPHEKPSAGSSYIIYGSPNLTNIDLASLIASEGFTIDGAATWISNGKSCQRCRRCKRGWLR